MKFKLNSIMFLSFCSMMSTRILAGYSIGTVQGPFEKLGKLFQDYVDFMDGPFATMVIVVSIVIAIAAWNFAPKEGLLGTFLRAVVSGVVIMNIGTWVAAFK